MREAGARGEGIGVAIGEYARAVLCNGLGEYEEALAAACSASEHREVVAENWGLSELVEPATRTADGPTWRLTPWIGWPGKPARPEPSGRSGSRPVRGPCWATAIAAESGFARRSSTSAGHACAPNSPALTCSTASGCVGENRRVDARAELRTAHELSTSMGMEAFAERAGSELLATGEKVRKRDRRDARRADRAGASDRPARPRRPHNSEIGTRLFLSPRTVEWHLHHVFSKLGIRSRRQLPARFPPPAPKSSPPEPRSALFQPRRTRGQTRVPRARRTHGASKAWRRHLPVWNVGPPAITPSGSPKGPSRPRHCAESHATKEAIMGTAVVPTIEVRPFHIEVPETALVELRRRISATRWPEKETVTDDPGRAARDDPGARALLGDGLRLAQVRGEAERPAAVHDRDRRAGHPLHPRPLEARRRVAAHRHARMARLDHRAAEDHRPARPTRRHTAGPRRTPSTGDPVDAGLRVLGQADGHRLGARAHRPSLGGADAAPRLHPLRRPGRRLGCVRRRPDGPAGARGLLAIHTNMPATVPADVDKALLAGDPPPSGLSAEERRAYEQLERPSSRSTTPG